MKTERRPKTLVVALEHNLNSMEISISTRTFSTDATLLVQVHYWVRKLTERRLTVGDVLLDIPHVTARTSHGGETRRL